MQLYDFKEKVVCKELYEQPNVQDKVKVIRVTGTERKEGGTMTILYELLQLISDSADVRVYLCGECVGRYDGKDSIPEELSLFCVAENGIRVNENTIEIELYE